jgi:hypothetical protein
MLFVLLLGFLTIHKKPSSALVPSVTLSLCPVHLFTALPSPLYTDVHLARAPENTALNFFSVIHT